MCACEFYAYDCESASECVRRVWKMDAALMQREENLRAVWMGMEKTRRPAPFGMLLCNAFICFYLHMLEYSPIKSNVWTRARV